MPALARLLIPLLTPDEVLFTLSLRYPENRGAKERGTLAQRHQSFLGMGWTCSEELPEECGLVGVDTPVCGIGTQGLFGGCSAAWVIVSATRLTVTVHLL